MRLVIVDPLQVGEVLHQIACRRDMVHEQVVPGPVPAGSGKQPSAIGEHMVGDPFQVGPAFDLPRQMVQSGRPLQQVDGMMVGIAAQPHHAPPSAVSEILKSSTRVRKSDICLHILGLEQRVAQDARGRTPGPLKRASAVR